MTDERGARFLAMFDGRTALGEVVRRYADGMKLDVARAAHSLIADQMSKVPPAVTDAIRTGRSVRDPMLSALSIFTAAGRDVRESGVEEARLNCSRRDGVARDACHSLP